MNDHVSATFAVRALFAVALLAFAGGAVSGISVYVSGCTPVPRMEGGRYVGAALLCAPPPWIRLVR